MLRHKDICAYISASRVLLRYRTCMHVFVSTVKRHQITSGIIELTASWRIQATCTSFQAVRGTVKVTVSYRNFFQTPRSNQICLPEKSLESYLWSVLETGQQMKNWHFQLPHLLSLLYVKSFLWDTHSLSLYHSKWVLIFEKGELKILTCKIKR